MDALVDHFTRFARDEREMPTVWHQSLLAFVQRYKHEVRAEDKDALKRLMRTQQHYQVSPPSCPLPSPQISGKLSEEYTVPSHHMNYGVCISSRFRFSIAPRLHDSSVSL